VNRDVCWAESCTFCLSFESRRAPNILQYEVGDMKCFGHSVRNHSPLKPQNMTKFTSDYKTVSGHCICISWLARELSAFKERLLHRVVSVVRFFTQNTLSSNFTPKFSINQWWSVQEIFLSSDTFSRYGNTLWCRAQHLFVITADVTLVTSMSDHSCPSCWINN
jgi:hypothetical protein